MRKFSVLISLLVFVAVSVHSFATVPLPIILTNDDNPTAGANSATAFHLNPNNGTMVLLAQLKTGGTGLGSGYFAESGTAIQSTGACVFVVNSGSDTISSFAAPNYAKTGDAGFAGMFSTNGAGGSIALSPSGKLLVSGNSGTLNISLWSVGTKCLLTHLADYVPSIGADYFSPIAFTPDGKHVVVPAPDFEAAEIYAVGTNALTDINNVSWANLQTCGPGCYPAGMDFTNDSAIVVFGNSTSTQTSLLTASIGANGLSNPQNWPITSASGAKNPNTPWFSKAGAAGNGELYVGMSGFGAGVPSGEMTVSFVENPLSITPEGSGTLVPTPDNFLGVIRTLGATGSGTGGGLMVIAEFPNQIQTATIGAGGTLTLGPITTDANAAGLLSISVFPNNR